MSVIVNSIGDVHLLHKSISRAQWNWPWPQWPYMNNCPYKCGWSEYREITVDSLHINNVSLDVSTWTVHSKVSFKDNWFDTFFIYMASLKTRTSIHGTQIHLRDMQLVVQWSKYLMQQALVMDEYKKLTRCPIYKIWTRRSNDLDNLNVWSIKWHWKSYGTAVLQDWTLI